MLLRTFAVVPNVLANLIEEYTSGNSELASQDARIVWASLISPLEVDRYVCLPHRFSPNVSISSVPRKN